jgi:glycosyltransferase involved in cell wall biosynthesis
VNGLPRDDAPALLHVCGRFLPLSETFTYDLIRGLDGFAHHVIADTRENADVFPWPSVHVSDDEAETWATLATHRIDAVLCHFGPQCTRGMPIAAMLDVPVATIFHGYDISRLLRDRLWVERYRACFAAGMRALCISEAGRRKLIGIGCPASRVDVVRLGVDTTRFAFRPPKARRDGARPVRILTIARLVRKKGIHVALEAAARLQASGLAYEWRIVGDGPEREALEARAATLGVRGVTWAGALPRDEVERAFAWTDLYAQPSVTAENGDEEGIPVSLMEAMASGVPVVSTRHSGIPELVVDGRGGLLTDEGDADALASALASLAGDVDRAEAIAHEARRQVEAEFHQPRQLQRTASWISQTLIGKAVRPAYAAQLRPRRGLVLQTIDTGRLARKLTLLAHRLPDVRFDVWTDDPSARALQRLPFVHDVQPLATASAPAAEEAYDVAVVPFEDEEGAREQWAARLASAHGARRVLGLTMRDRQVALHEVRG